MPVFIPRNIQYLLFDYTQLPNPTFVYVIFVNINGKFDFFILY